MRVIRSFLFVPASRPKWIERAPTFGADALILDLEDSVPQAGKADARDVAARSLADLRTAGQRAFVRINRTPHMFDFEDVLAVVRPGLEGLVLPKPEGVDDIRLAAALLGEAESRAGLPVGSVVLVPVLETARSVVQAAAIAEHPRVAALVAASAKNGDVARSLGFHWTAEGLETLHLRSSAIAAARAAGKHPIGGLWQDVHDLAGLERWARFNRQLGFSGELVLHPSNVAAVNAAFTPSPDEVRYYAGMIDAFEAAQAEGRAAILYEGDHIDYAHVATAREMVALAQSMGGSWGRGMSGKYFDELAVGQVYRHAIRRTVTETDNLLFTALTHNSQPLHLDEEFAKGELYGTRVVNSIFTLGLAVGVGVTELTLGTTLGNLGFGRIDFPHPVRIGDTLRSETEVVDKRLSRSRPDAGIVEFETRAFNQDGKLVVSARRKALMKVAGVAAPAGGS